VIVLINGGGQLDRFGPSEFTGRLVSPRGGNVPRPGERWAGDNDAFRAWDADRFLAMLDRLADVPDCLFIAVPDVVGDMTATLERFDDWRCEVAGRGFPVALVGQDGAEERDIPWDSCDAWFVGGSTNWKLSGASFDLVTEANRRGKWTHMGRVNTQRRMRIAHDFGCDSFDGTGWSKFPDHYLKRDLPYLRRLHDRAPTFF
jgi:hypothetical protein